MCRSAVARASLGTYCCVGKCCAIKSLFFLFQVPVVSFPYENNVPVGLRNAHEYKISIYNINLLLSSNQALVSSVLFPVGHFHLDGSSSSHSKDLKWKNRSTF